MTVANHALEENASVKPTAAAKLNRLVMKKMQKALKSNPEINLISLFPSNYSARLKRTGAKAANGAGQ